MIRKVITYKDYEGNERTEAFYFHLNKAEFTEMQLSMKGGLDKYLQNAVDTEDGKTQVEFFKDAILRAYGIKDPSDPKRFKKSQELRDAFEQSEAYAELFTELATNQQSMEAFFKGIIPDVPNPPKQLS